METQLRKGYPRPGASRTHVRRWQEHRDWVGLGHVYQGRYKSFPVEEDEHFLAVARYVERNALRANLVCRAEEWRWSSLWQRERHPQTQGQLLTAWPIEIPTDWIERVNRPDNEQELEALRNSVQRGRPVPRSGSRKSLATSAWKRPIVRQGVQERRSQPTKKPNET